MPEKYIYILNRFLIEIKVRIKMEKWKSRNRILTQKINKNLQFDLRTNCLL